MRVGFMEKLDVGRAFNWKNR